MAPGQPEGHGLQDTEALLALSVHAHQAAWRVSLLPCPVYS
jgi:hypothetical protein